jgi:hypothetical protein
MPFSRDKCILVSNRISTERDPASSEFCRSSRNTVLIETTVQKSHSKDSGENGADP